MWIVGKNLLFSLFLSFLQILVYCPSASFSFCLQRGASTSNSRWKTSATQPLVSSFSSFVEQAEVLSVTSQVKHSFLWARHVITRFTAVCSPCSKVVDSFPISDSIKTSTRPNAIRREVKLHVQLLSTSR